MEDFRGICTRCGVTHSDPNHSCTDDQIRLLEIDKECGPRPVRDFMLANGYKGFVKGGEILGLVEKAEAEAAVIRAKK